MERLTFEVTEESKRKFKKLLAGEGRTVKNVLLPYVNDCIQFGIIDAGETAAELSRLKRQMQEIDSGL